MYALSATAAGVGTLALAQPAEAKIVYTPAHAKVVFGKPFPMDLNHDGRIDFYLVLDGHSSQVRLSACQYWNSYADGIFCTLNSRGTNAIRRIYSKGRDFAAALRFGDKIERGDKFAKSKALMGGVQLGTGSDTVWYGPWINGGKGVKHRYLGLKFKISGRVHFAWARLNVPRLGYDVTAILTGYAYETVPNKPIVAGKTEGPNVITMPMDMGTLGHLALGRK
jgi:hypothetical protein